MQGIYLGLSKWEDKNIRVEEKTSKLFWELIFLISLIRIYERLSSIFFLL